MMQPMFQGLIIRSTQEDGIRWDAKGPIKRQTYNLTLFDSLYPSKGNNQHPTPLAADEIRLEAPFAEDGLQGTEVFILKSQRLAEESGKLTGKALRANEDLRAAHPDSDFFTRQIRDENAIDVPEELGKAATQQVPQTVLDILNGDDVELISAERIVDRSRSATIADAPEGTLTQPLSARHRAQRWNEHKARLAQALEQTVQQGGSKFKNHVNTVEAPKRFWEFLKGRNTQTQLFNSFTFQGDANAFQGVYAGKQ